MSRIMDAVFLLYPKRWRKRYRTEIRQVIDQLRHDGKSPTGITLNLAAHGFVERGRELAAARTPASRTVLILGLSVVIALMTTVITRGPAPSAGPIQVVDSRLLLPDQSIQPVMPAPVAPATAWQEYETRQLSLVEAVDWYGVHPFGCKVDTAVVSSVQRSTPGAPSGVTTDGVTITGQCPTPSGSG